MTLTVYSSLVICASVHLALLIFGFTTREYRWATATGRLSGYPVLYEIRSAISLQMYLAGEFFNSTRIASSSLFHLGAKFGRLSWLEMESLDGDFEIIIPCDYSAIALIFICGIYMLQSALHIGMLKGMSSVSMSWSDSEYSKQVSSMAKLNVIYEVSNLVDMLYNTCIWNQINSNVNLMWSF